MNTKEILELAVKTEKTVELLKEKFVEAIKDQSVSLKERWELFCNAPEFLHSHGDDVCDDPINPSLYKLGWYDDFFISRYQTVNVLDILDDIENDMELYNITNQQVNEIKERILQANILTFVNDW